MTVTEERPAAEIGAARRRKEDARLITGRTRWTDNITLPGMLHIAMVRSPVAHGDHHLHRHGRSEGGTGRRRGLDRMRTSPTRRAASRVPGRSRATRRRRTIRRWRSITSTFAGEIVAMVVARTAAEARDAAELVDVDYDDLPPALDLARLREDKVLAHPDLGTNVSAHYEWHSADARHRRRRRGRYREASANGIVIERDVQAAAAHPGVHGAALDRGRPDRRADRRSGPRPRSRTSCATSCRS